MDCQFPDLNSSTRYIYDDSSEHRGSGDWHLKPEATPLGDEPLYWIIYDNILYTAVMLVLPLTALTVLNVRLIRELRTVRRKKAEMMQVVLQRLLVNLF